MSCFFLLLLYDNRHDPIYFQCSDWSDFSCCDREMSKRSHEIIDQFGFNIAHCGENFITDGCREYFIRNICYYNCDPYTKPWIVDDNVFGKERIMQVPLCKSDCINWWHQCSESWTCVRNWRQHFVWQKDSQLNISTNVCPAGAQCQQIKYIYMDALDFCQTVNLFSVSLPIIFNRLFGQVWDNNWRVVNDDEHCVKIKFNRSSTDENPNELVANYYNQKAKINRHETALMIFLLELLCLVIICYIIIKIIFHYL